jgi:hypothetical protein
MIESMKSFMESVLNRNGFNADKDTLKFGERNLKLDDVITLSLPAGHSCPFAKDCRSCAIHNPRKRHDVGDRRKYIIQDGPETKYRCFTAIDEVLRPNVRLARWHNFFLLLAACRKSKSAVVRLIEASLPPAKWGRPTRAHVAGDFFNQTYFDAWMEIARRHPNRLFYAYTKALPFWIKRLKTIPKNFKLTASYGGTHDDLIKKYKLRYSVVVSSLEEAKKLRLPIDHDDSHAYGNGGNFALLLHGTQPEGSFFAKAWKKLIDIGMGGYGKQKIIRMGSKTVSVKTGYFS